MDCILALLYDDRDIPPADEPHLHHQPGKSNNHRINHQTSCQNTAKAKNRPEPRLRMEQALPDHRKSMQENRTAPPDLVSE